MDWFSKRRWLAGLLWAAWAGTPAFAETIELVTYYPTASNTGNLHADSLTVGTAYQGVTPADGEAIIYDSLGIGPGFEAVSPVGRLDVAGNFSGFGVPPDPDPQAVLRGALNRAKQLRIGFNTTGNYGVLQAIEQGVGVRPLVLQESGGNVGIGTTTPNASAPGGGAGHLDANDIYLRSTGRWMSQTGITANIKGKLATDIDVSVSGPANWNPVPYTTSGNRIEVVLSVGSPADTYLVTYAYWVLGPSSKKIVGAAINVYNSGGSYVTRALGDQLAFPLASSTVIDIYAASGAVFITGLSAGTYTFRLMDFSDIAGTRSYSRERQMMVVQL